MVQISSRPATPEIRSLFDPGTPASLRCFAVLDGSAAGQVWADHASDPTWAVAQEAGFGSIYLGGSLDAQTLSQIVAELRKDGDVLIGLSYDDERFELLPPNPDYVGATLEFTNRSIGEGLAIFSAQVPVGCELRRIDRAIFERCLERDLLAGIFGSAEKALDNGFGYCLMKGSQILSEAYAGPSAIGLIEIGTTTHERYRGRGYATLTCAHLVEACEALGFQTYWNCAKHNLASAAIARKLGYGVEREYKLVAWFKRD